MSAKQAAKAKAKKILDWFKQYRAASIFMTIAAGAASIGLSFDQMPDWSKFGTVFSAAWSAILWLKENSAARVSDEVSSRVTERIWQQVGGIQTAINENVLPGMQQLSQKHDDAERAHEERHAEHERRAEAMQSQLDKHGNAIREIGEFVRPDWKWGS